MHRYLIGGLLAAGLTATAMAADPAPADPERQREDSYYHYSLAQQARHRRDFGAALLHLQEAVRADAGSAELTLELGRLYAEVGRLPDAVETLRAAVRLSPDTSEARLLLAQVLSSLAEAGDPDGRLYEESLAAYDDLDRIDPGNEDVLLSKAKLQIGRGRLEEAADTLNRLLSFDPGSEEGAFLAGQVFSKVNRHEEARTALEGATERHPDNLQLRIALAEVYEATGDLEKASQAAAALLEMPVDPVRVRFMLARLEQRRGNWELAFDHLATMARLMDEKTDDYSDADRAEVHLRLVQTLLQAGKPADALGYATSAAGRFPGDPRFNLRIGEALLLQGRSGEAEAILREGQAREQKDAERLARISEVYLSAGARRERWGDQPAAERHLRKAITLNPQNDTALNYLGYMLVERGEHLDEAIDLIERALVHDPENGAYLDSLGWAFYKKGDYARAEQALRRALERLSDEAEIHAHLGDLYYATGRTQEAVKAWREALDLGAERADEIRSKLEKADRPAGERP